MIKNNIKEDITLYESNYIHSDSTYNETSVRRDFIDPFFEALGWDISNKNALPQNLREVILEANVEIEDENKKPDYVFRLDGNRKFFVEAKKPSIKIESNYNKN